MSTHTSTPMPTEEHIRAFIAHCRIAKNLSDKTIRAYKQDLASFSRYASANGDDLLRYVDSMLDTGHKVSTIKRHLATIAQFYRYTFRHDRAADPMLRYDFHLKSEHSLPRTLTLREVRQLLSALYHARASAATPFAAFEATRDLALVDLLCSTGIRIGEAAAMTTDDVDLRTRIILIHGKGKKERLIYLSCPDTVTNLRHWLALRSTLAPAHAYVFLNRTKAPLSINGMEDIFAKYRDRAAINSHATPHYLRHTFATNLLANGSDLRSVQELLGHSSVSVTERYTEVTTTRKIKVLKKFNYRNDLL